MKTIIILLLAFGMKAQELNDSLIAQSDRLNDTTITTAYEWGNKKYVYEIKKKYDLTTFELIEEKKLFTDYRKIGGLSYFFGMWGAMVAHGEIKKDKVLHFGAGYGIGMLTYSVTKKHRVVKSLVASTLVGILKEVVYDKMLGKGTPSVQDALWTSVGGYYGTITIPMFKTKTKIRPILIY